MNRHVFHSLIFFFLSSDDHEVNPLGPYTPEAAQAVAMATNAIQKSQALLRDVELSIEETRGVQRDLHKSVNNGLTKKVAETVAMKVSDV